MADEQSMNAGGILGHLPPLPRKPLNNSVIAMEQAYRQRKGLPVLTDAEVEALKAGVPMPWEAGAREQARPRLRAQRRRKRQHRQHRRLWQWRNHPAAAPRA